MKKYRNVVSFIISFVLMIMVIASIMIVSFKNTIINDEYYIEILDDNNISSTVYNNIYKQMSYSLLSNNISKKIFDNVITEQEVDNEIKKITVNICNFLKGQDKTIEDFDASQYANKANDALDKYLSESSIELTDESKMDLEKVKDDNKKVINSEIEWMNFSKLSKTSEVNSVRNVITNLNERGIIFVMGIIEVVLIVVLFMMWKHRKHRACAWIGYSLISAGLMVFIVFFSGYLSGFYENINLAQPQLKLVVESLIGNIMVSLSKYGGIIALVGIGFVSVYWRHLYRRNKREKRMNYEE